MMIAVVSAATGLIGLPHLASGQTVIGGQTAASGSRNTSGGNSNANSGRSNSSGASSANTSGNSSNAPAQRGSNNNNGNNNNTGGAQPAGSGTAGSTLGVGTAKPIDPTSGAANADKGRGARARNRARNQSQLINAEGTTGFAAPVIVPYYGAVPYNGFGFGYNYGGWGDYYDNETANVGEANGGSANPPAASPATATQNPDAEAARSQLVSEQSRLLKEYMNSPEYKQALADVRKATDDFKAAVAKVRGAAAQAPDVKDAHAKEDQAQRQVEAKQAAHRITPGATQPTGAQTGAAGGDFPADLTAAAQKKLDAKTQAKRGEGDRLMQDPDVKQSKQRLDDAVAHLQELQSQFEQQVTGDKQWQEAKQKLDTAMAGATPSNRKD
jgi:hypothetical protein